MDGKQKKRGRKPKKKEETEAKSESPFINNNLVIRLKEPNEIQTETNYECLKVEEFTECKNQANYGKERTGDVCWNCCHEFNNIIVGMPMKYNKGIFYTYGDFCSLECCSRYAYEYFHKDYWEILSNINLYNKHIFGSFNPIEMAPSKLVLQKFGGTLFIDDYRVKKDIYEIQLPPILPINHLNNVYEKQMKNQYENLKLYRKKKLPSDKKSITKTMGLTVS
jgi:hypothetical protein